MIEMVVNGISTRKVRTVVEELCSMEFSKSTVSSPCKGLNDTVKEWNNRDLKSQGYLLFVSGRPGHPDAAFKCAPHHRDQPHGILGDLGFFLGDSESEVSWSKPLSWLKTQALKV